MRELAQVNVAVMRAPLADSIMARFVDGFDPVARLAEASPGFVWRLRSASGHATVATEGGEDIVINVSVWRDYESLHAFVYRSGHGRYLRQRAAWFLPTQQPSTALWWVEAGERPTLTHAVQRLAYLRANGPSPRAFSLLRQFDGLGRPIGRTTRRGYRA